MLMLRVNIKLLIWKVPCNKFFSISHNVTLKKVLIFLLIFQIGNQKTRQGEIH